MNTPAPAGAPPADIESLLAEFDKSGQSAAAYARSRGIAVWRLRYALTRRSGKLRARPVPRVTGPTKFVPVELVDAGGGGASLELVLAGGHRLQIREGFDPGLLRRVVEALARC